MTSSKRKSSYVSRCWSIEVCNSIVDFPSEILTYIFLKLPITSLLRCRPVCKLWCKIVDDPYLSYMQLKKGHLDVCPLECCGTPPDPEADSMPNYDFCLLKEVGNNGMWKKPEKPSSWISYEPGVSPIVGSCNGLVCLRSDQELHIVNPLYSGDVLKVSFPAVAITDESVFGFGFDNISNRFKIVYFFGGHSPGQNNVLSIFELGTDSSVWRQVPLSKKYSYLRFHHNPVSVNGCIHWLARSSRAQKSGSVVIVSLNLATESFNVIRFPGCGLDQSLSRHLYTLFDFDDNLGLVDVLPFKKAFKIWVKDPILYGKDKKRHRWSQKFRIKHPRLPLAMFTRRIEGVGYLRPCHILLEAEYKYDMEKGVISKLQGFGGGCIFFNGGSLIRPSNFDNIAMYAPSKARKKTTKRLSRDYISS